jgi:hypothetical protein
MSLGILDLTPPQSPYQNLTLVERNRTGRGRLGSALALFLEGKFE